MSYASYDRVEKIFEHTIKLEREKRIKWAEGERSHGYYATFGESSLFVGSIDDDGVGPYEFSIIGKNGTIAGTVSSHDHEQVRELCAMVRDQYLGVDDVLDEVERGLGIRNQPESE